MATRRYKAHSDYVGHSDKELTFHTGDIIFVPEGQNLSGKMLQGVCNGKVGTFPKIYADDTTVEVKSGSTARVVATRAYEDHGIEGHLSFPKGAAIFVVGKHDDTHFKGVFAGTQGLLPATHIQSAEKKEMDVALAGKRCVAIKTMVNDTAGKLSFKVGMVIFVPKPVEADDDWTGVSQGVVGSFPKSYVVDSGASSKEEVAAMVTAAQASEEEIELSKQFDDLMTVRGDKLKAARSNTGE